MSSNGRASRERTLESGIVIPGHNAGHPMVVCQTNVSNLQLNVAIDHEQPDGAERVEELAARICEAQIALETGDYDRAKLKVVDPQYGCDMWITPAGLRSIVAVIPGYAKEIDPEASKRLGHPVLRPPADWAAVRNPEISRA